MVCRVGGGVRLCEPKLQNCSRDFRSATTERLSVDITKHSKEGFRAVVCHGTVSLCIANDYWARSLFIIRFVCRC